MAVECFFKIEGPTLKASPRLAGLADQIDVLAWSWGASQSGTMHVGTGGGGGKANVSDLQITNISTRHRRTCCSPCINGKQFDKATLTCRKAGDASR